ncbi:hypothetical protein CLU79DRAFT_706307 [Phycomyces nitens]|nr:hypothetical protein CLU79DRAFT_706307 [Phycomyces nitens]
MLVGNIPLKREYLGQSVALQNMYIAVMAEKIYNEIEGMSTESRAEPAHKNTSDNDIDDDERSVDKVAGLRNESLGSLSSEYSLGEHIDPQMMLHDRMDFLEQSLYRMSRKSKKKVDEVVTGQQELESQVLALEQWKTKSDLARKSERVWMFMVMLSILIGSWVLR